MVAGSADLHWLPESLPNNVGLIVSVAPGRYYFYFLEERDLKPTPPYSCFEILSSSAHRGWRVFEMQALVGEEKEALVGRTLARVGKKLDAESVTKLSSQNVR